jgi:hypothetical protein
MSRAIEYRIELDEDYLVTALRRTRELKPGGRRPRWTKWLIGPLFLGFGVLILALGNWFGGSALLLMGAATILGDKLDDALARRSFRRSPYFETELRIGLGESSCKVADAQADQELDWKLFPKARAFDDGILLESVEGHARWLPNSALVSGTQAQAEELLRAKVANFAVVPWRSR